MSLVRFRLWAFVQEKYCEYGRVAQVVEHLTFNQVVRGSNPRTLMRDERRKFLYLEDLRYFFVVLERCNTE